MEPPRSSPGLALRRLVARLREQRSVHADEIPEDDDAGYFLPGTDEAVADYRAHVALITGDGPLLAPAVGAARDSGLERVLVTLPDLEAITDLLPMVDLVIHVADLSGLHRALSLDRLCAERRVPLAQLVLTGADAWLFPLRDAKAPAGVGWSAAWPRRWESEDDTDALELDDPAATAVADQLIQDTFRRLTGLASANVTTVTRTCLNTLSTTRHRYLPHPLVLPAAPDSAEDYPARISAVRRCPSLTEEVLVERAKPLLDDLFGIMRIDEQDWSQVPLHVMQATVRNPMAPGERHAVIGAAFGHRAARAQTVLRGLALYGALTLDQRRLINGQVLGTDLSDRVRRVEARVAFPMLKSGQPLPVGVAAGYGWDEAVLAGIIGHCPALAMERIGSAEHVFAQVDLADAPMNEAGERCRFILERLGEQPRVYDVSGMAGIPTYGFCLGDDTVAYACGTSASAAIGRGLLDTLLAVQARICGESGYAPPPVPDIPPRLRGSQRVSPHDEALDLAALSERLRRAGSDLVVVRLDHDLGISEIMPFIVNIVVHGNHAGTRLQG